MTMKHSGFQIQRIRKDIDVLYLIRSIKNCT